jgi:CRISPR type I-E-associated protein CasA/Cse1
MTFIGDWIGGKQMPTFRLDQEPWIPVVVDGCERHVNLIEVFEQAPSLKRISGESLEVAGLMRFLLALAHTSFTPPDLAGWKGMWDDRPAFLSRITAYLRKESSSWDLFSPQRPFLQVADLRGHPGSPLDSTFLDRSKSGRDPHVDHSAYLDKFPLSSSAAARALLALHTFCMGGMGTPNPLIPSRGKDFDKFSSNSLAAQSCVAFLEGETVQDSLLLNLIAGAKIGTPGWCWPTARSREKTPSTGVADNYSRPARTVLLYPSEDGSRAESAFVTSGAAFADGDAQDDPLIPHVKGTKGYLPFRIEGGVALWRSANVFLAIQDKPLKVIDQLARLTRRYELGISHVTLRVIGISGKAGQVKHYFWRDQTLPFGISVVADDARFAQLDRAVQTAAKKAKETRNQIYAFAARYLQNGAAASPVKNDIGRLADELSPDLADFWGTLAAPGERIACDGFDEVSWAKLVETAAENAFRNAIERLPPDARRYRAEFTRRASNATKQRKGATA